MIRTLAAVVFMLACTSVLGQTPLLPATTARSWLLLDVTANHLIAASNADDRVEPASLTKLVTAYVVFSAIKEGKLDRGQVVPVSEKAWKTAGSKMFIEPKKSVTAEELLHGMIVQSGNDASVALAELVAGSEEAFAQRMNATAKKIGLKNSNFVNASGLPDSKHYSTAYDLALVAAAIIREFPDFYPLYAIKEYRYNNITQANRNRLLWLDPNVDGVKTGHTDKAGFCLIASAKRGDRRLISVVMGTPSDTIRAQEAQTLLNFGFQHYDTVRVHEKGASIAKVRIWKGGANEVDVGMDATILVAIPKGTNDKIKAELATEQPIFAPITRGQRLGTVKVSYEGRSLGEHPAVALDAVGPAGLFGRGWDTVKLWFK
ncbi:MAG: D-alanyl-D-alanine carboxypeptidase family protein [Burkholderiales bacterium]